MVLREVPEVETFILKFMRVVLCLISSPLSSRSLVRLLVGTRTCMIGYTTRNGDWRRLYWDICSGCDGLRVLLKIVRDNVDLGSVVSNVASRRRVGVKQRKVGMGLSDI